MADVSKLKVDNTTYDIKDEKTRSTEITWAAYQQLPTADKNSHRYIITDYPARATQDFQFAVMPDYQDYNLGDIIQYVGPSDSTYTRGYFYMRYSNGWGEIPVQYDYYPVMVKTLPHDSGNQKKIELLKVNGNSLEIVVGGGTTYTVPLNSNQ